MERQKIEAIFDEVVDLQTQKNKIYGNSFEQSLDEFGRVAGVVQVSHKFNRLKQIANDETVKFETERDTAIDIIGYMVMYVAWLDKEENVVLGEINRFNDLFTSGLPDVGGRLKLESKQGIDASALR